jgi:hypothetical protein
MLALFWIVCTDHNRVLIVFLAVFFSLSLVACARNFLAAQTSDSTSVYATTRLARHNFSKILCHYLINAIENDGMADKISFQKKKRSEQSQHWHSTSSLDETQNERQKLKKGQGRTSQQDLK